MTIKVYAGDIRLSLLSDSADISIQSGDVVRDEALETAILISIYTDARNVEENEFAQDVRGWWATSVGSLLWLLERSKTDASVLGLAEDRIRTCLQWLVEDGVAKSLSIRATRQVTNLQLDVSVYRPDNGNDPLTFRFFYNWQAQLS